MTIEDQIQSLVKAHPVLVFMKGTRSEPRCGFSAALVDCLDRYLEEYKTVDVLSVEGMRDGVKAFSDWPTIPQLFVNGTFVGGSDIVRELDESGELPPLLGVSKLPEPEIEITVTEAAAEAMLRLWQQVAGGASGEPTTSPQVRLEVDRNYAPSLYFDEPRQEDLVASCAAFTLLVDVASARRSQGMVVDWVSQDGTEGFRIDNPAAPASRSVQELSVHSLKEWLDEGKPITLLDVRGPDEIATASIPQAVPLTDEVVERLEGLPRDTTLVFLCHHGVRSRQAGEHCLGMGFSEVFSVAGGIDAWSQHIDTRVPRY